MQKSAPGKNGAVTHNLVACGFKMITLLQRVEHSIVNTTNYILAAQLIGNAAGFRQKENASK